MSLPPSLSGSLCLVLCIWLSVSVYVSVSVSVSVPESLTLSPCLFLPGAGSLAETEGATENASSETLASDMGSESGV